MSIKSPNVNVFIFYKMKVDYEKLREMAELGHPGKDKMVIKNTKGVVLKPLSLKWQSPTSAPCLWARFNRRMSTWPPVPLFAFILDLLRSNQLGEIASVALLDSTRLQGGVGQNLRLQSQYYGGRQLYRAAQVPRQDVAKRKALPRGSGPKRPWKDYQRPDCHLRDVQEEEPQMSRNIMYNR